MKLYTYTWTKACQIGKKFRKWHAFSEIYDYLKAPYNKFSFNHTTVPAR